MDVTYTVNADKRYYLDENDMQGQEALLNTIERFNLMKTDLYNALYDKKYSGAGPLTSQVYSAYLKRKYHINDYYAAAVYSAASGILSSQSELQKLHKKTVKEDIKARESKIEEDSEQLSRAYAVKSSLKTYAKTGEWVRPYPRCSLKIKDGSISGFRVKSVPAGEYERIVENRIRKLKTRIALMKEGLKRKRQKLEKLESMPPKKAVFGRRQKYRQKDADGCDTDAWKEEFHFARNRSIILPGRHDSKNCNFLVSWKNGNLHIRCMAGEAVLKGFRLARMQEEWEKLLRAAPADRKPVCYNLTLHTDGDGRVYVIPSVTMTLTNNCVNTSFADGCVSMDMNYDHVALSDIDAKGNRTGEKVICFNVAGKTSGQVSDIIGRAMSEVGAYCADRHKCLVMEDIDTTVTKSGMKYGNKKRNRHASMFAYKKMASCIRNQAFERSFDVVEVDPAYTSQIGKILYMRKMGISIHEAASYTIGLKGMRMYRRLIPGRRLKELLPESAKKAFPVKDDQQLHAVWKPIVKAFKGVRTHEFYRQIPYKALKNKRNPGLRALASEMEKWRPAPVT